ncbi:hypothetical protein DXM26_20670 [Agrobacterium tumefaciens]|uniref:hypothetical protein n=1 Tax=Agrobacterium tumefaciens TaxID=358 RepID=UPI00122FC98B|nr:hypothetical protein DXM26_20670 [Agrobacterium tumefaciens]
MTSPSQAHLQLLDIVNMIDMVKNMNMALHMATADIGNMEKTNALQSVTDEIENRISIILDHIEDLRGILP